MPPQSKKVLARVFPSRYNTEPSFSQPSNVISSKPHFTELKLDSPTSLVQVPVLNLIADTPRPSDIQNEPSSPYVDLKPTSIPRVRSGTKISSSLEPNTQFILRRPLGQGTFSSVWLAEDISEPPLSLALARKRNREKRGNKSIPGTKPMTSFNKENSVGNGSTYLGTQANGVSQQNGNVRGNGVMEQNGNSGRLVAVKMTPRAMGDDPDCTRVSFIREVEVLRVRILFPHPPFAFLYHLTI
jgi:hypothetical protein